MLFSFVDKLFLKAKWNSHVGYYHHDFLFCNHAHFMRAKIAKGDDKIV